MKKMRPYGTRETLGSVLRGVLPTVLGGAAGCAALALLCCEPANDGPITWEFILLTKVGGFALLLLAGWIYRRFIDRGRDDDRA